MENLFSTKLPKVNFTRWFQAIAVAAQFLKHYHLRLFIMMHLALEKGLLNGKGWAATEAVVAKTLAKAEDAEKKPMRQDEAAKLRKATKNNLHLAVVLLLDPMSHRLLVLIVECTAELLDWYQHQEKELRSCIAAQAWVTEQVAHGFSRHLIAIMSVLSDEDRLERMGLRQKAGDAKDPFGHVQKGLARKALSFCMTLTLQRVKRFMHVVIGWPLRSCLFAWPDESVRNAIAQELLQDADNDRAAQALRGAYWSKVNKRSLFRQTAVDQLVQALRRRNGTVDHDVQEFSRRAFSMIMASKGSEDGICVLRRKEDAASHRLGHLTFGLQH